MVKSEKTSLGRALVRKHNQMILETKEKGRLYRKQANKTVLESYTEVTDIEAIIENAEEAERLYSTDHPPPNLPINLDGASEVKPEEMREQQKIEEAAHQSSLRVPRRPQWTTGMSKDEFDDNEKQAFLVWRRSLARLEENENLVLTPFEKNLDIWKQLWRVLERSDLMVMVVDARDPLFYRCPDLEAYAREIDEHKKTLLLVNKADLLPHDVRKLWAQFFHDNDIPFLFWSAKAAYAALQGKQLIGDEKEITSQHSDDTDTKVYGRDELLARLQAEAEVIAARRQEMSSKNAISHAHSTNASNASHSASKHVVVGFVGYPNVGKSSTINALVGEKRTGVTSTPGKTKHFQTLIISDELMLCDCPGLVFPSFTMSRFEMIASGVLPIDRMTRHRDAVQIVANNVPRHTIENVYNITLPNPKSYESQSRPPLAAELLRAYCSSRGYVVSSGLPDETKASRLMLKDYIDGKLPHFKLPPGMTSEEDEDVHTVRHKTSTAYDSGSSDFENSTSAEDTNTKLETVLDDLESFDIVSGLKSKKAIAATKPTSASYKQHKKPQRKKDRTWRVGNEGTDGMPVARVFQKLPNAAPLKV